MKKAWVLAKIYLNSLYGFDVLKDDLKKDKKDFAKKIGLLILILFSLSGVAALFVQYNISIYDALKPINQQNMVIFSAILTSVILILVFGIISVISTYFMNNEGSIILSMPLKGWQMLFAKYITSYFGELIISFAVMSMGCIVYGVKSGAGFMFYVAYILVTLMLPVIPLAVVYIIVVPLMKFGNFLKKKDTIMIITAFLGIAVALVYQYAMSGITKNMKNQEYIASMFKSGGIVNTIGKVYYPAVWGTNTITNSVSLSGFLDFLLLILVSVLCAFLLISLMQNIYASSLIGSDEVKKGKKMSETEFKTNVRKSSITSALLSREIKLMNREPVFFLNGPFVVILLPVILIVCLFMQGTKTFVEIRQFAAPLAAQYKVAIAAGISAFIGSSTSIAPTCISREGKTFGFIKSLPIKPEDYIMAKFYHSFIFAVFADVIGCLGAAYLMNMGVFAILLAFVISILIEVPFIFIGIMLELAWPKLDWDEPQKAVKQNVNAVICVLVQMFGIPAVIGFTVYLISNKYIVYALLVLVPLVLTYILSKLAINYGKRRFYEIGDD